jgi:hypothetical protein
VGVIVLWVGVFPRESQNPVGVALPAGPKNSKVVAPVLARQHAAGSVRICLHAVHGLSACCRMLLAAFYRW